MTAAPDGSPWSVALHRGPDQHIPVGAGIVIDTNLVLTCHHVAFGADGNFHDDLWVAFPLASKVSYFDRRKVRQCLHDGKQAAHVDLVVLELVEPVPATVSAARLRCLEPRPLVDRPFWAYGFPTAIPGGTSATGTFTKIGGYGHVMIDSGASGGLSRGFSGGAVWSPEYQAVIGVVVSADSQGKGQAVTLHHADEQLPEMKLGSLSAWRVEDADDSALSAWGWALSSDGEAGRHWLPRARGVGVDTEGGAWFRGRTAALRSIVSWLDDSGPVERPLIVTGSPGVGKSAALGRVVTTADRQIRATLPRDDVAVRAKVGSVSCAVHAKGKTAIEVATEIAQAVAVDLPGAPADLMPAVRDRLERRPNRFALIIDALDEAVDPGHARQIIDDILLPLARDCGRYGVRVVVGTRRSDDQGNLVTCFGDDAELIDLDAPEYFAEADLVNYAQATLQLLGVERPANPYADPGTAAPLARRIAALAKGNFLVAGLVARTHALRDTEPVDPATVSFTATVAHALDAYLAGLPAAGSTPARLALTVLAYAETPGLPLPLWQAAVTALGGTVTESELLGFARTAAANFLVESGGGAQPAYRLFHQALNDALLADRDVRALRRDDQRRLVSAWVDLAGVTGWAACPDYLLRSLPQHAARAGLVERLLTDEGYLLHAHLDRLLTVVDAEHTPTAPLAQARARLLQRTPLAVAAEPAERAALLSVVDRLDGLNSGIVADEAPYRARWAHTPPRQERSVLDGHSQAVYDVAAIEIDNRRLLASAGDDGTVRLWDPLTNQVESVFTCHADTIRGVCAVRTGAGEVLIATASHDGTVGLWEPRTGRRRHELRGHHDWVRNICVIPLPAGDLLVSAGDDRTVRVWDPDTGDQRYVLTGHVGWVTAVTYVPAGGRHLLASTGFDSVIRIWEPSAGGRPMLTLVGHAGWVTTLYPVRSPEGTLLASAGYDGTVRLWNPLTGRLVQTLDTGGPITDLCTVDVDGGCLLVSTGEDGFIRLWEVQTWVSRPSLQGHANWVRAVCELRTAKERMLATAGDDGTVRLWDPAGGQPDTVTDPDRYGPVSALCPVPSGQPALVAAGGVDGQVRCWDVSTGERVLEFKTEGSAVNAMCAVADDEEPLIFTAQEDNTVGAWNARDGTLGWEMTEHHAPVAAVCPIVVKGETLIASAGDDQAIRLWNPHTGTVRAVLLGHVTRAWVTALATVRWPGFEALASADKSGTVMLWAGGDTPLWLQQGHQDAVNALCGVVVAGRPMLVSASADHTIRMWDAEWGQPVRWFTGHRGPVTGLSLVRIGGRNLIASTSRDRTVRVWDPTTGRAVHTIPVYHPALTCCAIGDTLVVGLDQGLLALAIAQ
ncbi:trypsin-like peptidase domain-containing protein [Verrucosispora sp. WMMD573]|uniref:trypsin-like peptidase domain-containing protein n=1 Tax=Verrucosispora sp. WMMD573 TaxID=3015149 RepID=UPI00248ACF77|nr:trypsin-like peptidase domain-containing protein [Verrucosispora sp. WMMD573]WBB57222.1 trypsin-like peptidase domain-containing protein [Verrucosispora sp. WMMD573]